MPAVAGLNATSPKFKLGEEGVSSLTVIGPTILDRFSSL